MITEYVRYRIAPERAAAFEEAYTAAVVPLATSPRCVDFDLARCIEEPDRYVLRIRWDSLDGHLAGFRGSDEFRDFFAHIRPYVDAIEEMQHYEPLLGGAGAGAPSPPLRGT